MDDEHQLLRDSSGLFVLDGLSPGDRDVFARHLTTCADCSAEVRELRETAWMLVCTVTMADPPAFLRGRVLAAATHAPCGERAGPEGGRDRFQPD